VGDVKQAIYVWRGGDPSLFEEVPGDLPAELKCEPLPYNWRAKEELVRFNNRFFSLFSEREIAHFIAGRFLYAEKEEKEARRCPFVAELSQRIREIFARAEQEIRPLHPEER
jgi:ATP-dependent exoDNAse (exonuclease V) beta subunit